MTFVRKISCSLSCRFVQYLLYCVSSSLRYVHSSCWGPIVLRSKNQYRPKQHPDRRRITIFGIGFYRQAPQQRNLFFWRSLVPKMINNFAWLLYNEVYFKYIVKEKYNFISKIRFYRQISSKKFNTRNHLVSLISYTLLDALFHPQLQDVFDPSA